jgi:hypothetical protein
MNSPWASLKFLLPPTRTSRQRLAVAGGALLLLAGLAWGLWALLAPQKVDDSKTWFSVEFTTDSQAHPVHLTLPDGKEGLFDLLMIENLSDKTLSLLAFSSRPRIPGLPPDQVMTAWAQWIATSKQGIIVQPRSSWVLNPNDLDCLPSFHGHTWISVFFDNAHPATVLGLPATVLPPAFHGRFRVSFCLSRLPQSQIPTPQRSRQAFAGLLQSEVDSSNKTMWVIPTEQIITLNGLTEAGLR